MKHGREEKEAADAKRGRNQKTEPPSNAPETNRIIREKNG
jgi:hypothetical protein